MVAGKEKQRADLWADLMASNWVGLMVHMKAVSWEWCLAEKTVHTTVGSMVDRMAVVTTELMVSC